MTRLIDADALLEKFKENDCGVGFSDFEIQAFITNAPTIQREGWVSVEDRLPEIETDVLVCGIRFNSWYSTVAGLFNDKWLSQETEKETLFDITHWQPLPAAPTDKE